MSHPRLLDFKQGIRAWTYRIVGVLITAALTLSLGSLPAAAQYPDRPVKLIVGTAPGNAVDTIARIFGRYLSELWKQPVVVENVGGANGLIAARAVANAAPDGYTLMITTAATLTTNPVFNPQNGRFVLERLDPISILASNDFVLAAHQSLNIRTLPAFVGYAKANPSKVTVASSVTGGTSNLAAELFKQRASLAYVVVPHNGSGAAVTSILGGHTNALFDALTLSEPAAKEGHIVLLATTGATRSRFLPNVPTMAESGYPGIEVTGWIGMVAPKGTSKEIIQKISADLLQFRNDPQLAEFVEKIRLDLVLNTPAAFQKQWAEEIKMWEPLRTEGR